jgi:hypothetical protein
MIYLFALLENR